VDLQLFFHLQTALKRKLQFEQNILMSLNFSLKNMNLSKLCWLGLMAHDFPTIA
jgi:hypothetical protein